MPYGQSINWSKVSELITNSIDWFKAIELINNSSFAGQYPLKTKRKRIKKVAFLFL